MATGKIDLYSPIKGCGFIQPDDGTARIFVSSADIDRAELRSVQVGMRVTFTLEPAAAPSHQSPGVSR